MSCSRRATTMVAPTESSRRGVLLTFVVLSMVFLGRHTLGAEDESLASSALIGESLANPISGTGLVLPISNPLPLASHGSDPWHEGSFSALAGGLQDGPAQPIPIPLPPGVATGVIGLAAAAIARYRWMPRRG